jgi:rhamnose transport system permease protein
MVADGSAASMPKGNPVNRALSAVGRSRELTLTAVIVVLSAFVAIQAPNFLSVSNLSLVTTLAAIIAIAAVGESLVIITKNVDLSIESVIGLVAFAVADVLRQKLMPVPAAWLFGIGLGLVLGMGTGLLVTVLRVPSIVAGLGTLSIYRGFVFIVAGGHEVNLVDLPPGYSDPASQSLLGIPYFVIVAIIVVVIVAAFLRFAPVGRQLYAVGSNAEAAAILGIRSQLVVFGAFALCGMLGGLAGILWGIQFGTIYATSASGLALQIIAAAVVGGVAIAGGSGTVVGAALGALFLALINNALLLLLLPQELLQAIYGAVILVAVGADALLQRRERRAAAERVLR